MKIISKTGKDYIVYDMDSNVSKETIKAHGKKARKGWCIAIFIVIGIIAYLVTESIGTALIAGGIAFAIAYVLITILGKIAGEI